MIRTAVLLMTFAIALSALAQSHHGAGDPATLTREAAAAYTAGRYAEAAALYRRLTELLPRSISAKVFHARALARSGDSAGAIEELRNVIAFGVRFDTADPAWGSLRGDARFTEVESLMRARTAPLERSETAFLLEKDLIPENIAWDATTRSFYVGSMYKAKIIRIAPDGTVSDWIASHRDGLMSVLGMKVDPVRRELWAVTGNFIDSPPMQRPDPSTRGQGAIFRYDLNTGSLIRKYPGKGGTAEEPMRFNDLAVAPNGDVYATAGGRGIWRIRSGAESAEVYATREGSFFNGIAITDDGTTLFAASHVEGIMKVDLATGISRFVDVPRGVTLAGIDGLYVHRGSLVAVQNGIDPARVIRAWLDPERNRVTRFEVLEQAHHLSDIPLTGTIVGEDLYYVARSQLRAFDSGRIWPMERLRESVVLKLPLEPPAPHPDLEKEKADLLAMHRQEIRAHVERDAAWIAETTAEQMVTASDGRIQRTSRDEMEKFFTGYFEGARYLQYEDLEPPVVRVSDDGSMAWTISRIRVRREQAGKEHAFVYAGIMAYEKRGTKWVRVANVSTFERP